MKGTGSNDSALGTKLDVSDCEREPIRIPGSIQPHGILFVLSEPDWTICQVSVNADKYVGIPASELIHCPLAEVLGSDIANQLHFRQSELQTEDQPVFIPATNLAGKNGNHRTLSAVAHRRDGAIILELETAVADKFQETAVPDDYHNLGSWMLQAEAAATIEELSQLVCSEVRRLTGFDRAMVYQFGEDWNGTVIGEDGSGRLPSYLNHRFPASDIPAQARELYRINRVRIIPDANYTPVPIIPAAHPQTGRILDMSLSVLRSVSPIHVEYMKNMKTAASMSVSILREGRLWGLISCHHAEPKNVPFTNRTTCDLIARAFALRLSGLEKTHDFQRRIEVRQAFSTLLGVMADHSDFAEALAENHDYLLHFVNASGAAVLTDGRCLLLGTTPTEKDVRKLADWLFHEVPQDVFSTDSLLSMYPACAHYKEIASGILAVAVSKIHASYVIWFRPEVIQTIQWGGEPAKRVEVTDDHATLHPRRSFETWRETVRDRCVAWQPSEMEGAAELRNTIVGTVLRKAEELADLNDELTRSNKELEAFSFSVSHDLRAPLRHIVGYAEMLKQSKTATLSSNDERCINTIIESSEYAGRLVDKLLNYSRLGRSELQITKIDLQLLVSEIQKDVMQDVEGRNVRWEIGELPIVSADLMMLRMAVRDLLSNALKYTRGRDEAIIQVGCRDAASEYVFHVKDNGVGFDMEYIDKLFGVFQRLHKWEDYEGTGIGLANVRRVIERHGGCTWAEGEVDRGATFYFTLPKPRGVEE